MSSNVLFCPKLKDIQFPVIEEEWKARSIYESPDIGIYVVDINQ